LITAEILRVPKVILKIIVVMIMLKDKITKGCKPFLFQASKLIKANERRKVYYIQLINYDH
jgi:hypothetical protein